MYAVNDNEVKYNLRRFLGLGIGYHGVNSSLPEVKTSVKNIGDVGKQLFGVNIKQLPSVLQSVCRSDEDLGFNSNLVYNFGL